MSVTMTGDALSYAWYQGEPGDTARAVGVGQDAVRVSPADTTKYWVRVTSDCAVDPDAVRDEPFVVHVCPELVAGPQPVSVNAGTTALLSVQGSHVERVEWYRGQSGDTSGGILASSSSLSFTTPPIAADTQFWARLVSGSCFRDTPTVLVSLCREPSATWSAAIVKQIAPGEGTTLRANVTPDAGVSKTFYEGTAGDLAHSVAIHGPGADSSLPVNPTVTTRYWVRAQMTNGICFSDTPVLTIEVCKPAIATQPSAASIDRVTNPAATVPLSVTAAGSPLTYQWYEGVSGDTARPVAGGTSATVSVGPNTDTSYWVRVSGTCGWIDSQAALVTVCKPPAISQHPSAAIVTSGTAQTLTVTAAGTELHYQWYRGAAVDVSSPVGTDAASYTATITTSVDYWVRVTGRCGAAANSTTARLSVKPAITTQPAGAAITSGSPVTLTVAASGTYLTYQWYSGSGTSAPIAGATSASYTTPPLTAGGSYWCRVWSGSAVYADSSIATITICQPRTITVSNETQVSGQPVNLTITGGAQANETYEWYEGESGSTAVRISTSAAVTVNPTQTTKYWLRTIRTSCVANSPSVTVRVCYPAISAEPASLMILSGTSTTLSVTASGTPPLAYQWYTGTSGNTATPVSGAVSATLTVTPSGTTSYWVSVRSDTAGPTCSKASATAIVTVCTKPVITDQPDDNSLASTASVVLSITATGDGLSYQWYEGAAGITTKPVGTNSSSLSVIPGSTKPYWVRVTGSCGVADSTVALQSVYPKINVQPADLATCANQAAAFSVGATGTSLTYQWYRGNVYDYSQPIAGATGTATTINPASTQAVWCEIRSGNAATATRTATATVSAGPAALTPSKTLSGSCYKLTARVSAVDEGLVQYQWFKGALGDTSNPQSINPVYTACPTGTTTYWVRITYTDGSHCWTDKSITVP